MLFTYENLTPAALASLNFDDPVSACRLLQGMAGDGVPDAAFNSLLNVLVSSLESSADPDRAVANLARWAGAVGSRTSAYGLLAEQPIVARMLLTILAASQFFAELLIRNPEYLEVLTNPAIRNRGRGGGALWADLARRVAVAGTPNAKRDILRRFKPPEVLRIGIRDLLGFASMPETARAISDFADVCVQMAMQICAGERGLTEPPFAVFALGKLGGQELNYASDIDLIFVHSDAMESAAAIRLGEFIRDTLAKSTGAGFVFRVDLRLRPEGRFGPVSRSLESCRAYYESWAEPWERQALMKARFVAGSPAVGAEFAHMASAFVYPGRVEESFVESIRSNKRRLESKIERAGDSEVNVKEGIGGIRDIEFAVQLLQLVVGGAKPHLRTGNTLEALGALTAEGLLSDDEQAIFQDSYKFLRTVEHRLQLRDELPIRNLPRDPVELRKFGRRLGYADEAAFLADYRRHTARVHLLFERLFYGEPESSPPPQTSALSAWAQAPEDPVLQNALRKTLAERGFQFPEAASDSLRRSLLGSEYGGIAPEAQDSFAAVLPALVEAAAATADPDAALRGLDSLALAVPSHAALYQTLSENQALLTRLSTLAASSPPLWQILLTHLELLDSIADEEALETAPTLLTQKTLPALAAQARRARLKTGTQDLWGLADTERVMAEVTDAAEATLESALAIAREDLSFSGRFAIIGLGKLGGAELGYGSDFDVLYVADSEHLTEAARLAERIQKLLRDDLTREGLSYEMDARLRPDGRKGQLVLDLDSCREYYSQRAALWERQALLKARPVAGDAALGREFAALAESVVYGSPLTAAQTEEIQGMKRRIESERLQEPADLKLGPGGLTDIEWTTQLLQLRNGPRRPRLRTPNTLEALRRLRDDVFLTQTDWETLSAAYVQLIALRNRQTLKTGVSSNLPATQTEAQLSLRVAVRAICLRVFYEDNTEWLETTR